jgi:hypothetical protein
MRKGQAANYMFVLIYDHKRTYTRTLRIFLSFINEDQKGASQVSS